MKIWWDQNEMKKQTTREFKDLLLHAYKKGNNGATIQELMSLLETELIKMSNFSAKEKL